MKFKNELMISHVHRVATRQSDGHTNKCTSNNILSGEQRATESEKKQSHLIIITIFLLYIYVFRSCCAFRFRGSGLAIFMRFSFFILVDFFRFHRFVLSALFVYSNCPKWLCFFSCCCFAFRFRGWQRAGVKLILNYTRRRSRKINIAAKLFNDKGKPETKTKTEIPAENNFGNQTCDRILWITFGAFALRQIAHKWHFQLDSLANIKRFI